MTQRDYTCLARLHWVFWATETVVGVGICLYLSLSVHNRNRVFNSARSNLYFIHKLLYLSQLQLLLLSLSLSVSLTLFLLLSLSAKTKPAIVLVL